MTTLTQLFERQDKEFEKEFPTLFNGGISPDDISKDVKSNTTQSKLEVVKAVMEMVKEKINEWNSGAEYYDNVTRALNSINTQLQSELNEIEKKI